MCACLLDKLNGRLEVQTKVDERPFDAFTLVFLLFKYKHCVVEQLLKFLVRVVDTQLLERVYLPTTTPCTRISSLSNSQQLHFLK